MDNEFNSGSEYSDEIEEEMEEQLEDESSIDDSDDNQQDESDENKDEIVDIESSVNESAQGRIGDSFKKKISSEEEKELKNDLQKKMEELKEVDKEVTRLRKFGDLSENEAYDHATNVYRELQSDIEKIQRELANSIVVNNENSNKIIGRGSKVDLVITDPLNLMERQEVRVIIVSEGHGEIMSDGTVKIPDTSEVYRKMEDKQDGRFSLTGTDGNIYNYEFNIVRG